MEVIELSGTRSREAPHRQEVLGGRQPRANGLKSSQLEFADAALKAIIESTRARRASANSSARSHRRRKIARESPRQGRRQGQDLGQAARELLGKQRVFLPRPGADQVPGVATASPGAGRRRDLFVEASAVPGKGNLTITGQLGE